MVDMSGSTRGWINDAERESLVLLSEALEILGDRYAIYGFSGTTRKRCELFRIKTFRRALQRGSAGAHQRHPPAGIYPHGLCHSPSDQRAERGRGAHQAADHAFGRQPDDYHDNYRTQYGIEDTRKALQEAQRSGIHPFCITLDRDARDYLPHMYGAVALRHSG